MGKVQSLAYNVEGIATQVGTSARELAEEKLKRPSPAFVFGVMFGALLLFALLVTSYNHSNEWFFTKTRGGWELRQGKFAPTGTKVVATFEGLDLAGPAKQEVDMSTAYTVARGYWLRQAEEALNPEEGEPAFDQGRAFLGNALAYATTSEDRQIIWDRIEQVDYERTLKQAREVLAGPQDQLDKAEELLVKARGLADTPEEQALVTKKLEAVRAAKQQLSQ